MLTRRILEAEAARIQLIDEEAMKSRTRLTMLCDGWEDAAGRSIYATVVIEVGSIPVVLGLADLAGQRADTGRMVQVNEENLTGLGIDPKQIAGMCTDSPTTMVAARREWEKKYPHTIVRHFIIVGTKHLLTIILLEGIWLPFPPT